MREFIITTWGGWDEERVQRESLEKSILPNSKIILINNVDVGIFCSTTYLKHVELEQIYLLPEYQRLGIGSALIKRLIMEALQAQVPIRLRVLVVNSAKQFYERFGFIVTEVTLEFFYMKKSIL